MEKKGKGTGEERKERGGEEKERDRKRRGESGHPKNFTWIDAFDNVQYLKDKHEIDDYSKIIFIYN